VAVILEGYSLIVRNAILVTKPGGVDAFLAGAPSQAVCTDGRLSRIGFMAHDDMERYRAKLEATGLGDLTVAEVEVAAVAANDPSHLPSWLRVGRYGGCLAAWLADHDPEPLVVPFSWQPVSLSYHSPEDVAANLELVGRQGSLDVYRNKTTGETLYVGRTAGAPVELDDAAVARLQALYEAGTALVMPYLPVAEGATASASSWWGRRQVKKGIAKLQAVVKESPLWNAHWIIGMGYRALNEPETSLAHIRTSYELNPSHADVAREYVSACLALGKGTEAVRAASYNCKLHPEDAGLKANLGLALLVADRVDDAIATASAALTMKPDDRITQALLDYVNEVKAGRRPRPTRYP
jgi:tetratricopeptide (TPR) repeat protein